MDNSQKKILVVEDDMVLADILVDGLSMSNFKIFRAGDGEEALSVIMAQKPHVMLLDLLLPKVDGFKVLEQVRRHSDPEIAKTRVIVLSNLSSNKDILSIQALKVDEYYVKSNTNLQDVYKKVKEIVASLSA